MRLIIYIYIYIYIYNQWKQDLELGKDKIVKLLARLIKEKKRTGEGPNQ